MTIQSFRGYTVKDQSQERPWDKRPIKVHSELEELTAVRTMKDAREYINLLNWVEDNQFLETV